MRLTIVQTAWIIAILVSLFVFNDPSAVAVELRMPDGFSGTFPDTTTVWRVEASAPSPVELTWELILGNAVVDRGQRLVTDTLNDRTLDLPVRIPALREGLASKATLAIRATAEGRSSQLLHPVWILPADPWGGIRAALGDRRIGIAFDANDALVAHLHEAGLQTVPLRNSTVIAAQSNGVIIVGEGMSLHTHRGLVGALLQAAANGTRILILAPEEGMIPLPGHTVYEGLPLPAVRFERRDVLKKLNPLLDVCTGSGKKPVQTSDFMLSAERRQPETLWTKGTNGWAWLDLDFRESGSGRFLAVGWSPVDAWEAGPVPRHILATLLHHLLE